MRKTIILSIFLVMALFGLTSCAAKVSPQEYERVSNELHAVQGQLASLQGKLAEAESLQAQNEELKKQFDAAKGQFETMQAENKDLSTKYEELSKQYDALKSQSETMQAEYDKLNTEFEELREQYDIETKGAAGINAEDVEQAVFKLINQERRDNGLDEMMWGDNIYKWAIANSLSMATNKRTELSEYPSWQEVFWATGYGTADRIASAALTIWKNTVHYDLNFLNRGALYGTVAAYKSGDIFFITYIASSFK
jgi:prefoldin subunit 5